MDSKLNIENLINLTNLQDIELLSFINAIIEENKILRKQIEEFELQIKQLNEIIQKNKFLDIAKEIAIASKPVDIEIKPKKEISVDRKKDKITMPSALGAPLEKARITSNVSVHQKVDKVMNDEIKSSEALKMLYKFNFNEYTLSKILSVGVLGLKKDKRLVPTRWSITATDDTLGKNLIENIKN